MFRALVCQLQCIGVPHNRDIPMTFTYRYMQHNRQSVATNAGIKIRDINCGKILNVP